MEAGRLRADNLPESVDGTLVVVVDVVVVVVVADRLHVGGGDPPPPLHVLHLDPVQHLPHLGRGRAGQQAAVQHRS